MQMDMARNGIPMAQMTPVPMAVDTEIVRPEDILPIEDARLVGKRVVVYLGTLDPLRQIEILLQMLVRAREAIPDILLVLAGDTNDAAHRDWLKQEAVRLGVSDLVVWTGWLESKIAWRYAKAAEVGLSPIPRGYLLDMGSPTKAVEYMALGLPVLVNDNPDQAQVVAESGAGLCVELDARTFAESLIRLLSDGELLQRMGEDGRRYIARTRSYDGLAETIAEKYRVLRSGRLS
jgi:glycosyltransferase involved in cell wall biosynthesis